MDKLWLDVEKVLHEKMINTGMNIQLVSCNRSHIQISKENEIPTKKVVNNNPSLNQDVGEHHEEMASSEIVFLPEENDCNPIKSKFTKEKWAKLEKNWQEAETMLPIGSGLNENVNALLKKYSDGINKITSGYNVNLNKVAVLFDESSIVNYDTYSFTEEWPTQWIKSIYNTFLLCFQISINPHDGGLSKYAYRDKIVNHIIEDVFLDINNVIHMKIGEIENTDLEFGEVVNNAYICDDKKITENREKVLKCE
ncbi:hypothetical protein Glove_101g28 [Diversispora epigaea]|uniref:Uncharacterized protein n=1 Tax=Diversispora epigaea TaxID=1348612 RepID=A0A397J698_9GLOM|nr:hypothetical protein Glove_101g28 [Diversispora epigaea]